ncbi:TIM barrel protein [Actinomadura atramentaria]|uniref:TIM barrel protein n=1 Tax=Actinomadura atramentaria TaxID=1990 RepID=UPI000360459A|nr:TIM barrel protein [Actinomadura atramentaria]
MVRYAVNCSLLFTGLPPLERPAAAAAAGFGAVEFWWPWPDAPVPPAAEVDAFCAAIEDAGVRLVALNAYAGDLPGGERGVLSHPGRVAEFRASLDVLAEIAGRTGVRRFNTLYGQRIAGSDAAEQARTADANLAHMAGTVPGTILIEPLARGLNGDYPLATAADATAVVARARAAGVADVAFLLDTFHLAHNGDDPVKAAHSDVLGHVQFADAPGRGRPGSGAVDFAGVLAALGAAGYDGWVSLEYVPADPAAEDFSYLDRLGPTEDTA